MSYSGVTATTNDYNGGTLTGTLSSFDARGIGGIGGYGWFWDHFNMMLGAGLSAVLGDANVNFTDSAGNKTSVSVPGAGLALEFDMGWKF